MTLLIDTAPLVALADAAEPRRDAILAAIQDEPESLVIPAPTTAEIDYLLGQRLGSAVLARTPLVAHDVLPCGHGAHRSS